MMIAAIMLVLVILTTTTYMFCGMLLVEWLIQRFSEEAFSLGLVHWLSFAFAVAVFDELVKKHKDGHSETEIS